MIEVHGAHHLHRLARRQRQRRPVENQVDLAAVVPQAGDLQPFVGRACLADHAPQPHLLVALPGVDLGGVHRQRLHGPHLHLLRIVQHQVDKILLHAQRAGQRHAIAHHRQRFSGQYFLRLRAVGRHHDLARPIPQPKSQVPLRLVVGRLARDHALDPHVGPVHRRQQLAHLDGRHLAARGDQQQHRQAGHGQQQAAIFQPTHRHALPYVRPAVGTARAGPHKAAAARAPARRRRQRNRPRTRCFFHADPLIRPPIL